MIMGSPLVDVTDSVVSSNSPYDRRERERDREYERERDRTYERERQRDFEREVGDVTPKARRVRIPSPEVDWELVHKTLEEGAPSEFPGCVQEIRVCDTDTDV